MKLFLDNRFPPVINGKIFEIYPWSGAIRDHWEVVRYFLTLGFRSNFSSPTSKNIISRFFNSPNVFLVDSGRSALLIALKTLGVNSGKEVLVAAFNCSAVVESITSAGGTPKFIDVGPNGQLDFDSIKSSIGPNTKGLIVTHTFGLIDDLESISESCRSKGLFLVNDLAQVLDDPSQPEKLNQYGDVSIYSFGPEKHLYALGGGAIVTHRQDLVDKIKMIVSELKPITLRVLVAELVTRWKYYFTFYIKRKAPHWSFVFEWLRLTHRFSARKEIKISRARIEPKIMSPVQADILARKINDYGIYISATRKNLELVKELLGTRLVYQAESLPLYATLRLDAEIRYELSEYLSRNGVQAVWNYYPLYKSESGVLSELPNTEKLWQEVLSVPFRYPISETRQKEICKIVNGYFQNADSRN